jgi:hypothetical protein
MAFPATYNFNYYKGDTLEFLIKPKNSSGTDFIVTDAIYRAEFKLAPSRGGPIDQTVNANADIITDNSILCTLTPSVSALLNASNTYVYDVKIISLSDTDLIYTLLNGTITIIEGVTGTA